MADLLTTRQVQDLLQVDRTTIYRMIDDGRLPAIRVGKQWRFSKEELGRWMQTQGALPAVDPAPVAPPAHSASAAPASLAQILPLACVQLIQDAFAEMLECALVVTDMQGQPVTQVSNPSGLFVAVTEHTGSGWAGCMRTWQQMADAISLEPRFTTNELGLLCARGLIRQGSELKGLVVAGCIAPDNWPPSSEQLAEAAKEAGAETAYLAAHCDAVHHLDAEQRARVLRFVQRIADVFSHIAEDRSSSSTGCKPIAVLTVTIEPIYEQGGIAHEEAS